MFPIRIVCLFVLVSLLQNYIVSGQYRRVCYYTNWAQYRPPGGKFFPEDIDPSLCSHIVYAFAKLNGNKLVAFEWNDESTDWMTGMYSRYNSIKQKNPEIKTLLAVGGWNMASKPFTAMVATPTSRSEFATSTVRFLRQRNFDGIDIDWEYPANRGSPPQDKQRYTMLVKEVRRVFDDEARRTGRPALLLTSAVAAGKDKIDTAYDIPQICRDMDFISLMSYDLHGSWENVTGHNSPLLPHSSETGNQRYLNMDWSANYWVQMGCPKHKLVIGMGLYGRSFTLKSPNDGRLMAPVKGGGKAGKYTREGGFLAYYEICDMLAKGGKAYYIKDQEVPYAVLGDQWVGYDDIDSLRIKVQWMKQNGFSGVMVWALDLDDFKGQKCGQGPYPLLTAINQELMGTNMVPPVPRQESSPAFPQNPRNQNTWGNGNAQWTPQPSGNNFNTWPGVGNAPPANNVPKVTPRPPATTTHTMPHLTNEFDCPPTLKDYFPNPNSCHEYFLCAEGLSFKFKCAHPLRWNTATNYCDWPDNVVCTKAPKPVKPKPKPKPKPQPKPVLPPVKPAPKRPPVPAVPNVPPQQPGRQNNFMIPRRQQTTRRPQIMQQIPQQQWRPQPKQAPPTPPRIFTPRRLPQAPVRSFFTTPSPVVQTTRPPQTYPTPPWNDWYRFLSEFWRVMAALGAAPPGQNGNNVPGTIAGLPAGLPRPVPVTPRPNAFCADKVSGIYPDPLDCSKYIDCVNGRAYKVSCPTGTAFDSQYQVCDYKHNIARCKP